MDNMDYKICPIENSIPCDALKGIYVVELTEYVAAPMCGRMLADYGAEVIKIERPTGDPWRKVGLNCCCPADDDENPMFDVLNSKKKSVVLNLKEAQDLAKLDALIAKADIFVTNNRMKPLKKMGIDPESVRARYPKLIYGLITGHGLEGEQKDDPGFDSVCFWGRSGFMRDMAYETENGYPIPSPTGVGDSIAGALLLTGLLTALYKRERTGKGDFVTVSLLGAAMFAFNSMMVMTQPKYGRPYPMRREQAKPYVAAYKCADGEWLQIAVHEYARQIPLIMRALGIPELAKEPRFATEANARDHWSEMCAFFERHFLQKTTDEWEKLLKGYDITCSKLPHFRDIVNDKQLWDNGNLQYYTLRNNEQCVMPCPPVRFGSTGTMRLDLAPALGADTEEVLSSL